MMKLCERWTVGDAASTLSTVVFVFVFVTHMASFQLCCDDENYERENPVPCLVTVSLFLLWC